MGAALAALRRPLVAIVPSERVVAVAVAHGVVDLVAVCRCQWHLLWPYLLLVLPKAPAPVDALLFSFASVFHFACDGDLSLGAVFGSVGLHLLLVGLVAYGRTPEATGVVLSYLVGWHVPTLVGTLVEAHDRLALLCVLGSTLLALAAPRKTIDAAFGAGAYDPRTGALRFDAHVQRVVAAHAVVNRLWLAHSVRALDVRA